MNNDLISRMDVVGNYQLKGTELYNFCPEAFGEIGEEKPTFDLDAIHKKIIDEDKNSVVVDAVEYPDVTIESTLKETTEKQKRWRVFPRKLDMAYNKVVEELGYLNLIDTKDYYTGQFRNCMASGAVKGGLAGLGVGLFLGLLASTDVDGKSTWEAYQIAGPVLGSAVSAVGSFIGALSGGVRRYEPKFRKAKYLDKRIDELYHPNKNKPRGGGMVL